MTTPFTALACRVGLGRLIFPTSMIDALGEYHVGTRIGGANRVAYALGAWSQELVVSMSLSRPDADINVAHRQTAGMLLATPGSAIRWAFEVAAPLGIVEVVSIGKAQGAPWLRSATLDDGHTMQLVDLQLLLDSITMPTLVAAVGINNSNTTDGNPSTGKGANGDVSDAKSGTSIAAKLRT
jgi:hypothetical protein